MVAISELQDIRPEVYPARFDLDIPVARIFRNHPLYFAITWDYFCNGDVGFQVTKQAMFGFTNDGQINQIVVARMRQPSQVPRQFWTLHQKWFNPSMSQITDWRIDMVQHVLSIIKAVSGEEQLLAAINNALPELVNEMKKEFPDSADDLDRVFQSSGFPNTAIVYFRLLDTSQYRAATVYSIDKSHPNGDKLFFVITYIQQYMREFQTGLREMIGGNDEDQRQWIELSLSMAEQIKTPELKSWACLACDINPTRLQTVDLNQERFWGIPEVQTLTNYPESIDVMREELQLMIMYSDIDPPSGLNWAIAEQSRRVANKDYEELRDIGLYHTSVAPMKNEPWRKTNTNWQNGNITSGNWEMIKVMLRQVPRIETIDTGSRHHGEPEYIPESLGGKRDRAHSIASTMSLAAGPHAEYREMEGGWRYEEPETDYTPYLVAAAVGVVAYVYAR